jgi:hypothetical protein
LSNFPLTLKIGHTAFVDVLIPVYWRHYGPGNFLWFSDVALLVSVPALWRGDRSATPTRLPRWGPRLLASTQAIAVAVPESAWTIDFGIGLVRGRTAIGLAEYMFDSRWPLPLRALSLFHLWLPALLIWMVCRLGYDKRALPIQTLIGSGVLVASYVLTEPKDNVNWVFGIGTAPKRRRPAILFAALLLFPLMFYAPAHVVLRRVCGAR